MSQRLLAAGVLLALVIGAPVHAEPPELQIAHQSPVLSLAWSAKAQWLASGTQGGDILITDAATGKALHGMATGDAVTALAFAPDGKMLAIYQPAASISTWEIATGKKQSIANFGKMKLDHLAYTRDGQSIVGAGFGECILWRITGAFSAAKTTKGGSSGCAAVSADGSCSASADTKGQVRIRGYEPNRTPTLEFGSARSVAICGATLAVGTEDNRVKLWDWQAKKELAILTGLEKPAVKLTFSSDGKTLAGLAAGGASIQIWDLSRKTVRRRVQTNRQGIGAVALSPDGTLLAAIADNTVLVWNVATRQLSHEGAPLKLSEKDLADLWTDLASSDAGKSDQAWHKLGAAGDKAVPFLQQQIKPISVPVVDTAKIDKLAANLDSEKFAVRETASKELIAAGEWAVVPLERLLKAPPSAEAANRARALLKKIGQPPLTPDRQRVLEAVELLEQIRSAQALALLEEIERTTLVSPIRAAAGRALQRLQRSQAEKK